MEWTPTELIKVSGSYWTSCALHAAVHLDLFSPLAEAALTEADLAERMRCPERGVGMLVTTMTALGLLQRQGHSVALTPFSKQYLCRDSADYLGHIMAHHRHLVTGWAHLDEAVQSGRPVRTSSSETLAEDERESFLLGMVNMASLQASQCVPLIGLKGRHRLLDLGGGPGSYAVQFCRENPELRATVFDLPTTRVFAEHHIAEQGMSGRIDFAAGDYIEAELPKGFDVAWLSHILHGEGPESAARVVAKAARSLQSGGLLLIQEFIVDDQRNGPLFSALFGLNMLINTFEGQAYTESELAEFLRAAGAARVSRLPLELPNGRGVMVGEMP